MKYYYKKNRLILFWNIGKYVYQNRKSKCKSYKSMSNTLKYYFGFTEMFSISGIKAMEKFYVCFPIFTLVHEKLDWDFYKKLLLLNDADYRMLYFRLAIFSSCDFLEFETAISNKLVERI